MPTKTAIPVDKMTAQAIIRKLADTYLDQPNITSIGYGLKVKDGKETDETSIQFTVSSKIAPERLGADEMIPKTVKVMGYEFPTDVVERTFVRSATPQRTTKSMTKQRIDPIQPGASIGNARTQDAGTLCCLVQDMKTQEPLMLSNWHVFHGPNGSIGDAIVQPGLFDDNRAEQNKCGTLVRSFLGLAGDCAIAKPVGRAVSPEILEIKAQVGAIKDPDLGDRVVKSGRTSGVTRGTVSRIHVITMLDYGHGIKEKVGGFEVRAKNLADMANGEISASGDSGSAWMIADGTKATNTLAGVHFAGDVGEDDEYALACYATSVFEKLEIEPISAKASARVSAPLEAGFDTGFLAFPVLPPKAVAAQIRPTISGELTRKYEHFELQLSKERRMAIWVAWNIDGGSLKKVSRVGVPFMLDPEYRAADQMGDELYKGNRLDRGHIARRADLLWGTIGAAKKANKDSFYFTNITPQLDNFNQSGKSGIWGSLEDAIFSETDVTDLRLSMFGGPIFSEDDFKYRGVLVPREFFKVAVYVAEETKKLECKAFILTQQDLESSVETLNLDPFRVFQVPLSRLAGRAGLDFGDLVKVDTMANVPQTASGGFGRLVESARDI